MERYANYMYKINFEDQSIKCTCLYSVPLYFRSTLVDLSAREVEAKILGRIISLEGLLGRKAAGNSISLEGLFRRKATSAGQ